MCLANVCRDIISSALMLMYDVNRKDRTSKISVKLQPLVRDPRSMQISLPAGAAAAASSLKIIAASSLRGRLTIMSSRAYNLLPYPKLDESIFYSSPEWEQAAAGSNTGATATMRSGDGSSQSPRIEAQLSQDY